MELKNLVPPLKLCMEIPEPKKNFRDSYFAWIPRFRGKGEWRYIAYYDLFPRPAINDSQCIPAPTLEEIIVAMADLIKFDALSIKRPSRYSDDNLATAALKRWIEEKEGN